VYTMNKICPVCHKNFTPSDPRVRTCSHECGVIHAHGRLVTSPCKYCGSPIEHREGSKPRDFCSVSCSNKSRKIPGRTRPGYDLCQCGSEKRIEAKVCSECRREKYDNQTIQELIYSKGHRSNAFGAIRGRARTVAKNNGLDKCAVCGYTKHVEICHRKAISDFPETAVMSEVNAVENLIALCPTHHWEFDNL